MSAPTTTSSARQAQDYLAAVEHELADLPVDDRSALLEDLSLHLDALAAEEDDRPITVRLGSPAAYAADLRAAAGLPARPASAPAAGVLDRVRTGAAFRRALAVLRGTGHLVRDLRPAWWVVRGYLVVLVPCLVEGDGVRDFPVPAPLGNPVLGALLVVAAVAGSVALGRRAFPRPVGVLVAALGAVLVVAAAAAADRAWDRVAVTSAYAALPVPDVPTESYPLYSRYGPVTDVFPYAPDGTPLEGVLLYDQDGRPLKVGFQEWWPDGCLRTLDQPLAADGVPVPNSYPQSYEVGAPGVDAFGNQVAAGVCTEDLPRPEVPLPTFTTAEPGTD
ncbi:HAAS signaling domain-containing protein [Blastococcus deserti]|uniref:Proline-rich protein n=1 Tax=Blastococcus deserti TaxID=2259033 RepID=A0ABW4XDT4_9ACTN